MPEHDLTKTLQALVNHHGISAVLHGLADIESEKRRSNPPAPSLKPARSAGKRLSAIEYVKKITLPQDKSQAINRAAQQFENRRFLPSVADIREFCRVYRIEIGKSISRVNSIPIVFTFLSNMDAESVSRILDKGVFSGPARLAPIADAICGRAAQSLRPETPEQDQAAADMTTGS